MRLLLFAATILVLIWALVTLDLGLVRGWLGAPQAPPFDKDRNAVWLAHTWTGDSHPVAEIDRLAGSLAGRGFRYLFVHAGPFDSDGSVPPERYEYGERFVAAVKAGHPELVLLPWLGGLNRAGGDGDLDLSDPKVRRNIVAVARSMVDQGWDGVHLNVEPLPVGRGDFLALLDELRPAVPFLSVAGMRFWMLPVPLAPIPKLSDFVWDEAYLREVGKRVDQIAVMTYDSALPQRNLFIQYQRLQTSALIDAFAQPRVPVGSQTPAGEKSPQLLVGVPTYSDQRPNFNEDAENMASGLQGVIEGLAGKTAIDPFAGVAVYAHWTTGEPEWDTFERIWLGRGD